MNGRGLCLDTCFPEGPLFCVEWVMGHQEEETVGGRDFLEGTSW